MYKLRTFIASLFWFLRVDSLGDKVGGITQEEREMFKDYIDNRED